MIALGLFVLAAGCVIAAGFLVSVPAGLLAVGIVAALAARDLAGDE